MFMLYISLRMRCVEFAGFCSAAWPRLLGEQFSGTGLLSTIGFERPEGCWCEDGRAGKIKKRREGEKREREMKRKREKEGGSERVQKRENTWKRKSE